MTVRPATPRDAACIAAIHRASLPLPWSLQAIRQIIDDDSAIVLLAEDAYGSPIGFLSARDVYDGIELLNIAVLPSARMRGTGTALIHALLDTRGATSDQPVFLEVRESNNAARRLYDRFGFVVLSKRAGYYPDTGEAALLMVRYADAGD